MQLLKILVGREWLQLEHLVPPHEPLDVGLVHADVAVAEPEAHLLHQPAILRRHALVHRRLVNLHHTPVELLDGFLQVFGSDQSGLEYVVPAAHRLGRPVLRQRVLGVLQPLGVELRPVLKTELALLLPPEPLPAVGRLAVDVFGVVFLCPSVGVVLPPVVGVDHVVDQPGHALLLQPLHQLVRRRLGVNAVLLTLPSLFGGWRLLLLFRRSVSLSSGHREQALMVLISPPPCPQQQISPSSVPQRPPAASRADESWPE
mmetsp:Transcript_31593/g.78229  ORF Transcript_31593/g.78229 Transcript_31593/m.78229 type:complete len:259 (+) Transcript_31593:2109-2885(+)